MDEAKAIANPKKTMRSKENTKNETKVSMQKLVSKVSKDVNKNWTLSLPMWAPAWWRPRTTAIYHTFKRFFHPFGGFVAACVSLFHELIASLSQKVLCLAAKVAQYSKNVTLSTEIFEKIPPNFEALLLWHLGKRLVLHKGMLTGTSELNLTPFLDPRAHSMFFCRACADGGRRERNERNRGTGAKTQGKGSETRERRSREAQ